VERRRYSKQTLSNDEKEKPCHENSDNDLSGTYQGRKAAALCQSGRRKFLEARCANDAIVMLRDAFTAKESAAFGAARRRFPQAVIETALQCNSGI
jgi:hypothetical protein